MTATEYTLLFGANQPTLHEMVDTVEQYVLINKDKRIDIVFTKDTLQKQLRLLERAYLVATGQMQKAPL